MGVEIFAAQGHEKFPGFDRARIGADARNPRLPVSTQYFRSPELCNLAQ
jgi:hypothetical protein